MSEAHVQQVLSPVPCISNVTQQRMLDRDAHSWLLTLSWSVAASAETTQGCVRGCRQQCMSGGQLQQGPYLAVDIVNGKLLHLLERHRAGPRGPRLHRTLGVYHCNLLPWVVCQVRPQPPQVVPCMHMHMPLRLTDYQECLQYVPALSTGHPSQQSSF